VRYRLANVVASRDIIIWEVENLNPVDDPDHSPPLGGVDGCFAPWVSVIDTPEKSRAGVERRSGEKYRGTTSLPKMPTAVRRNGTESGLAFRL
jgi:hypothetical protein